MGDSDFTPYPADILRGSGLVCVSHGAESRRRLSLRAAQKLAKRQEGGRWRGSAVPDRDGLFKKGGWAKRTLQ